MTLERPPSSSPRVGARGGRNAIRALVGPGIAVSLLTLGSCVLVYQSEFHIVFDAEPETARQAVALEIEVQGPDGTLATEPLRFPLGDALRFPTEPLPILPEDGDWRRTFTVVARVLRPDGDGLEVFNERSFRSTFAAPGRDGRQTHRLVFSDDCILFNRVCDAGETCIDGRCAPIPFQPPETRRDEPLRVVAVANVEALTDAVAAARFGDVIELEPGTYEIAGNLASQAAGSDGAPIVVRAREPGTARIRFVGPRIAEVFLLRHPYWVLEGLEFEGACDTDDNCEHAVHVTRRATHTILRRNRFIDFNQAIHVNADSSGARPDDGLIEHNELALTRPRDVGIRVTGLRLAHASRWVVRGNVFRDLVHASTVAYAAFMDEGGQDGRFEGNLVRCRDAVDGGGPRYGLSVGTSGAGTLHTRARFENDIVLGCDSSIDRAARGSALRSAARSAPGRAPRAPRRRPGARLLRRPSPRRRSEPRRARAEHELHRYVAAGRASVTGPPDATRSAGSRPADARLRGRCSTACAAVAPSRASDTDAGVSVPTSTGPGLAAGEEPE